MQFKIFRVASEIPTTTHNQFIFMMLVICELNRCVVIKYFTRDYLIVYTHCLRAAKMELLSKQIVFANYITFQCYFILACQGQYGIGVS